MPLTLLHDAAEPAPTPLRPLHLLVVSVCMLVAFLDGFDVQMIAFMAPAIGREWQVEKEVFGLIFSSGIAGMLVGMVGQGPLSDRFGRKPMTLICVATFGLCTLACAAAHSTTELLLLRFVGGVGMGAVLPNVIVLVSEFAPAHLRSRMVVVLGAGVPIGGLVAGAISAWLLPVTGWRPLFVVGGVAPLLMLPVLALWLPESPLFLMDRAKRRVGPGRDSDERRIAALVQRGWRAPPAAEPAVAAQGVAALLGPAFRRSTLLLWLICAANMVLFYSMLSWMPLILTSAGTPESLAALSGAMLNFGVIVGSFPLGWAADRFGMGKVLPVTYVIGAGLFAATGALLGAPFAVVLVLCALLGCVSGGSQLLLNAFAGGLYPTAMRATGIGFAATAGRGGAIAGPALCGFLLAGGLPEGALLALLATPALIAALACAGLRRAAEAPVPARSAPGQAA
ncbi:MFS transporter [Phenylobacterium sp.]|uniref:MFS transporter n=1 Tax=Phenylobacterium sp. TaxID=1871053 RepID=UPI00301CB59A